MSKDYYKILGVDKEADDASIKRAYRKLAHKHHPDKNNGNAEKFKEINEAYQVLSDKQKRSQYDQFGQTFDGSSGSAGGQGFQGFSGFGGQGMNFDFGDLGDIFGDVFGGRGRSKTGPIRGSDLQMELVIDFDKSVFGGEDVIELYRSVQCPKCKGEGVEPGYKINTCETCGGVGQVKRQSQTMFGVFSQVTTCPKCNGTGKIPEKPCSRCGGDGISKESENIKIKIPAGIDDGETIKLSKKGEAGRRGGEYGDLYIRIRVNPSKDFVRKGYDIISEIPLSFTEAALGSNVLVKTIDGDVILKIPSGTQTGKVFILKSRGVTRLGRSGRGDHLVKVTVVTPKKLSQKEKKLFTELSFIKGQATEVSKGFFDKIKEKLRKE